MESRRIMADPLHFSNVSSNFGDDTFDQMLPMSPFHQKGLRKVSDQEYDKCEISQDPPVISDSMAFDDEYGEEEDEREK